MTTNYYTTTILPGLKIQSVLLKDSGLCFIGFLMIYHFPSVYYYVFQALRSSHCCDSASAHLNLGSCILNRLLSLIIFLSSSTHKCLFQTLFTITFLFQLPFTNSPSVLLLLIIFNKISVGCPRAACESDSCVFKSSFKGESCSSETYFDLLHIILQ